jgi:hypothetical protein
MKVEQMDKTYYNAVCLYVEPGKADSSARSSSWLTGRNQQNTSPATG